MSVTYEVAGKSFPVRVEMTGDHSFRVVWNGEAREVDLRPTAAGSLSLVIDGRSYDVYVDANEEEAHVLVRGETVPVRIRDPRRTFGVAGGLAGPSGRVEVTAPMPGKVVAILVEVGQEVQRGQGLVVVEAMKMENELVSPRAGKVAEIRVKPGMPVESKAPLVIVE